MDPRRRIAAELAVIRARGRLGTLKALLEIDDGTLHPRVVPFVGYKTGPRAARAGL